MARMVKGAKWTYGWVVVGTDRQVKVPPQAWAEFGFQRGDQAVFLCGSRTSGGFSLSTPRLLERFSAPPGGVRHRLLDIGRFGDGQVSIPRQVGVRPGDRLLTARGSRCGLGFISKGPIYEEALAHPALDVFETEQEEDIES
jgi:hypothetical protein